MAQRGDLAATLAVVAFLTQVLVAQCTLALVICFLIIGRASRWRSLWLAVPAFAGVVWLLAIGLGPAVAGYLAGGGRLLGLLAHHGTPLARLRHLHKILVGWRLWLPGQLPIALIAAAAQAAVLAVHGRAGRKWSYRPGCVVAARTRYLAATLRRGELATADGCCLGIVEGTGKPAIVAWREAGAGMLCTGQDAGAVSATGLGLAIGAIQHRKTVIVIDLGRDAASAGRVGAAVSARRGDPRETRPDPIGSACAEVAAPLRRFGWHECRYDPLSAAGPARATSLAMAMLDWAGVGHSRQLFCANYLNVAFQLMSVGRADAVVGNSPVFDELCRLMVPGALGARFASLRDRQRGVGSLAAKVAELSGQLDADHSMLAPIAAQFGELNSAAVGQLMRPSDGAASISLGVALAGREVVLFQVDRLAFGRPAAMIARLVIADLIENLAERSDLGGQADAVVWVNGCEAIDERQLAVLVALGERTGTAVVLGTAIGAAAARLATEVNVVAVRGASPAELVGTGPDLAARTADSLGQAAELGLDGMADALAELHAPGSRDVLSLCVRGPRRRLVAGCRVVR